VRRKGELEIRCTQSDLKNSLDIVKRGAPSKSVLPSISCVLIEAEENLFLTTTDLELRIKRQMPVKVVEAGKVLIPVGVISEFVSTLPDDQVIIKSKKNSVNIKCGRFESNIKTLDPEEFPAFGDVELTSELGSASLRKAFSQVVFAAAQDDFRPVLSGIYIDGDTVVAADGFRMSIAKVPDTGLHVIIPAKAVKELTRVLDAEDTVLVGTNGNVAVFSCGNTEVSTRLIEGQFPDYKRIVPPESENKVTVNVGSFLNANKVSSIFARDNSNIINIQFKDNNILVSAASSEVGDNTCEIDAEIVGEPADIRFNAKYLDELLKSLDKDSTVTLNVAGSTSPGLFTIPGEGFIHVIMPMSKK
jgi:DNA polymerase-3 subunit beta